MKKAVTIVEIAKILRMSVSTVSKALNDHPAIGAMTKARVKEKAAELHYIPNQAARFFQKKKSFQIGVIVPSLRDPFYVGAVTGIETRARKEQYITLLCQSHEDPDREAELVNTMLLQRVDGLIITLTKNTRNTDHLKLLQERGIPVVHFVRIPDGSDVIGVGNNVFEAAANAVKFLRKQGHEKIGHLCGPQAMATSVERLNGYKYAMEELGIPVQKHWIQETDLSCTGNEQAFLRMMERKDLPTAVLAFKDNVALDAINLCQREAELKKYQKIKWVGFGNTPELRYMNYPLLASVEEHPLALGEAAFDKLLEKIQQEETEEAPDHPIIGEKLMKTCEIIEYDGKRGLEVKS